NPAALARLEWRLAGPFRGGRSTAVAGVAERPHLFYMGTTGGGVWKSDDAGASWRNVSDGYFGGSIGAVGVAPSDPEVIYVGEGSACLRGNSSVGRGAWRSTDGGETWQRIGLERAGQIGDVAIHPTDPDIAYVAALGQPFGKNAERGVFRTRDGGASWEHVLFLNDSTGVVDLALHPTEPNVIYAGAWRAERKPWTMISGGPEGGVYRSTDAGDTWSKLGGGLPQGVVGKVGISIGSADPERVWVIIEAEPDGGVYRSDDGGTTFTRVNDDNRLRQRAWYYTHIEADPQDPDRVYVLNVQFLRSTDGGETFEPVRLPHGDVHDLWINPNDSRIMGVADDGGVQVSLNDGDTWTTYYNQPTAELYDVVTDNAFPYRLYGAQQDNTTIRLPAWTSGNTIHPKEHWTFVGGCETGPVVLHPDHPDIVYAGCYGGVIDRFDLTREDRRNLVVYPELQLGQAMADVRERFQWVAPIVVSPHDPNTIYHASQRVHRSRDGGYTWQPISGDLTTNTPAHQVRAGGPINADVTGVETFNTIFSLAVSPHDAAEIWAGSDDGRVHITRDDGASWSDITPPAMPRLGTVDEIELSPHEPGRATLAVHRYRLDDFRPYVFQTDDWGRSWRLLTDGDNGIPADHPTRTVREDPEVQGLLFAGTEFGIFASFDDGRIWTSIQGRLPTTPVTGIEVAHDDLVIATQGRSFWVLDDVTPLREWAGARAGAGAEVRLFQPRPAYRTDMRGYDNEGTAAPPRKPGPALIQYYLPEQATSTIRLEVLDAAETVLAAWSSDTTETAAASGQRPPTLSPSPSPMPDSAGLNRVAWDLAYPGVNVPDSIVTWGFVGGPLAPPGEYTVRLSADGATHEQVLRVLADPRMDHITQAEYEQQLAFALAVRDTMNAVYDALRTVIDVREQVDSAAASAAAAGHAEAIAPLADTAVARLDRVLNELTQTRSKSRQDPIRFPGMLDNQYAAVYENVAALDQYRFGGPDGTATSGARERFSDLNRIWAEVRARVREVMERDVARLNAALRERGLPPVVVPAATLGPIS
ncbi:MAG: WD40/YVTN/BNR-like repeat-containing protein, partial [Longimicrobiales bacterium]